MDPKKGKKKKSGKIHILKNAYNLSIHFRQEQQ